MKELEMPVQEKVAQIYDRLLNLDDDLESFGMTPEIAEILLRIMNLSRVYINRL